MGDGREKFATYTREVGGLDYAGQRYYSPVYGRFTSADRYSASAAAGDPSTWNRYSYTGGDPVNRTDPGGQQYIPQTICGAYGCEEFPGIYCGDGEPWDPGCAAYGYTDPADWCSSHPYDASCSSARSLVPTPAPVISGIASAAAGIVLRGIAVIGGIFLSAGQLGGSDEVTFENAQKRDLQQFKEAIRQYQSRCGRALSLDEVRRVHDSITGQGYSLEDIVEEAVAIFGCPGSSPSGTSGGGNVRPPGPVGPIRPPNEDQPIAIPGLPLPGGRKGH